MKARHLEAAGGKPGHAGRPGHVLFSGPSPRTKAEGAAGAGTPVSGALGAALLAAGLLLAPGEARALIECGTSGSNTLTCSGAAYNDGIYYPDSAKLAGTNPTVNVPGRSAGSTTITAGSSQAVGIHVESQATHGFTVNVGGSTGGTAHVVNIVQGTNSVSGANRNNGVYLRQQSNNRRTTLDVRSGVTIGSSTTPMKQNGIYVDLRPTAASLGVGATAGTITSAAPIHAARQGIRIVRQTGGTNDATTVTNTGALHSGVNNAAATGSYVDRPHGIYALHGGTQRTGSLTITNSGDITVGGAYTGILMNYWGAGALSLDNSGDIAAATGQTANQGIQFNYKYWDNQSAQAITLTNSGDITAFEFGIRLTKLSGGDVELTNSGDITVTGNAAHAIYLVEGVTFGEGRTYAANGGALTVDNRGVLSSKNHALYVYLATADDDVELENSGAVTSEDGDGIRIERTVEGDVAVENSANVSGRWRGIYVGKATRIDFEQTAGTITSGRTGVTLQVTRESGSGDTRSADGDGNHVPAIDVAWTGGNIARGTAESDAGRFPTASLWSEVFAHDREAAAGKALEETLHYGGPAGIEAHALSWRDVVTQVAKGDDPGAFANAAAQRTAVPTGATAGDNVYVAQLRAALENEEISVVSLILTDIDSTATSVDDLSDAEIVTYLRTDAAAIRTVLRNVLAQGLSDDEKAILRAVATGDGVDAALTAAGFTDDPMDDADYWSLVKALLDRHNLDDIRIAMTAGSIDSRGDGIRAYYATPNANNGGIDVTVAEGVSVTADRAGIYVANAGGDVTVSNSGTVTGGTYGIYAANADAIEVTVAAGASVAGGAAGVYVANAGEGLRIPKRYAPKAIRELAGNADAGEDDLIAIGRLNAAGDAIETPYLNQLVEVAGTVTGGTDAAVHLNSGGAVIVMAGGKVHAGASGVAIKVNDPGPAHLFIDGEVKGGEGGAAAVHLTGGGSVIVGLNGRVQADGADNAIQGGGDEETGVDLVAATAGMIVHREDAEEAANARVEGRLKDVGNIRFREHRNGVFTGYGSTLPVGDDGMLDASTLEWGPCPEGQTRGDDGECRTPPPPPPPGDGSDGSGSGDDGAGSGDEGAGDDGAGSGDDGSESGPGAPTPTFSCAGAMDGRCRLYEALPSMLVAMNALPSYAERTSAARDGNGGWARVEAARGGMAGEDGDEGDGGDAARLRPSPQRRACGGRFPRGRKRSGGGVGARAAGQGGDGRRGRGRSGRDGGRPLRHLAGRGPLRGRAGGGDVVRRRRRVVHARQDVEEGRLRSGVRVGGGRGQADERGRDVGDAARGGGVVEGGPGRFRGHGEGGQPGGTGPGVGGGSGQREGPRGGDGGGGDGFGRDLGAPVCIAGRGAGVLGGDGGEGRGGAAEDGGPSDGGASGSRRGVRGG